MKINNYEPVLNTTIRHPLRRTLVRSVICSAIAAGIIFFISSCKSKKEIPMDPDVYYTCSMDPQVIENKPGKCPICHMKLTQAKKSNSENQDEILLSEQQIELGNIQSDTIHTGTIGDQLVLTATLNFDQMKASSVSSRVMGRVEKLYFKSLFRWRHFKNRFYKKVGGG